MDAGTSGRQAFSSLSEKILDDEFLLGTQTSGSAGELGWTTAGTVTIQQGDTDHPGVYRFATGATSGTVARLAMGVAASFDPAKDHYVWFNIKLNHNDANTTVRIGAANSSANNPPADGIYFEKLDADTNWFMITRASNVQTRTDTGIATNTTNYVKFEYYRNGTGVLFYINGTLVGTLNTNIPTTFLSMTAAIVNSTTADKQFQVNRARFKFSGMVL